LAFAVELGDVPSLAAGGETTRLVQKAQLHGLIPVAILRLELKDVTGTCFNHCDRDDVARRIVNLRHPDLSAE
jgi:hypothetical protein